MRYCPSAITTASDDAVNATVLALPRASGLRSGTNHARSLHSAQIPRLSVHGGIVRDRLIGIVEKYIDAVRRNDPTDLPLHPDVIGVFPMNTYQGAEAFVRALEPFSRIVKSIDVVRLVVDGEHCVAILHVVDEQIVSVRGYYDPRPMLGEVSASA
jgi:hypothetical protein